VQGAVQGGGEFGEAGAGERRVAVADEDFADVEQQREGEPLVAVR
jgi:hypothetical protein